MARSFSKWPIMTEHDVAGCIGGFMSMLDFYQRNSTGKFRPNSKHHNARQIGDGDPLDIVKKPKKFHRKHKSADDDDEMEAIKANFAIETVKDLMEKEMAEANSPKKVCNSDVGKAALQKNNQPNVKKFEIRYSSHQSKLRISETSENFMCNLSDASERSPILDQSSDEVEMYPSNHLYQDERFNYVTSADNSSDADNRCVHQCTELMNNKLIFHPHGESLMKLHEYPTLHLSMCAHSIQNDIDAELHKLESCKVGDDLSRETIRSSSQSEECEVDKILHDKTAYKYFGEKYYPKWIKTSNGGDGLKASNKLAGFGSRAPCIVSETVAPSCSPQLHCKLEHQEQNKRMEFTLSPRKLIKNLRHTLDDSHSGKLLVSMDDILQRIPSWFRRSGGVSRRTSSRNEFVVETCSVKTKLDMKTKSKENKLDAKHGFDSSKEVTNHKKWKKKKTLARYLQKEGFFHNEIRNFDNEMTSPSHESEVLPMIKVIRTLEEVLYLPEHKSLLPKFCTGSNEESGLLPKEMRHPPIRQSQQKNSGDDLSSMSNLDSLLSTINSSDLNLNEDNSEEGLLDSHIQEETCTSCTTNVKESSGHEPKTRSNFSKGYQKEGRPKLSEVKIGVPDNIVEKSERPSPVSVLEPIFLEKRIRPVGKMIKQEYKDSTEVQTTTVHEVSRSMSSNNLQAKFEYIRYVLEASHISCSELPKRWHLSGEMLDPFLFHEIKKPCSHLIDEPKLLFDCINQVLVEIHNRIFGCSPWIFIIMPNVRLIPLGENFLNEVCKGILRHLNSEFLNALEELIEKDFVDGIWMDLLFDAENTLSDIGDVILEDLMEEFILDLWVETSFSMDSYLFDLVPGDY